MQAPPPIFPQAASGVRRAMMVAAVISLFAMRIGYAGKTLPRLFRSARSAVHVVTQRVSDLEAQIVDA